MAISDQLATRTIHGGEDEGDLVVLTTPTSLLEKVGLGAAPTDFGLPDLLADGLTPEQQNARLRSLLAENPTVTAEVQELLTERARTRALCEAEMLKHFLEVSRAMPPEQGRRYLAWVQEQTVLQAQAMERRHKMDGGEMTHGAHH